MTWRQCLPKAASFFGIRPLLSWRKSGATNKMVCDFLKFVAPYPVSVTIKEAARGAYLACRLEYVIGRSDVGAVPVLPIQCPQKRFWTRSAR